MKFIFALLFFVFCYLGFAQNNDLDVLHYKFELELSDTTDLIHGRATINFRNTGDENSVYFDLIEENNGKGMRVTRVGNRETNLSFQQKENRVYIDFASLNSKGKTQTVEIAYQGIPADGLIIDHNKFGERTFFSDNWPERARNWLPGNDHPSDKATVEFVVIAPNHYQVVGNGVCIEETSLPNAKRLTHWKMESAVPTKVMAIGVADFAVRSDTVVQGIPITNWVFAKNRDQGIEQYKYTGEILPFFSSYIAPFPYKKLANVQSKTIFGGMENASNIFYYENSVKVDTPTSSADKRKLEALMAHEMAHQWFGNSVSETDWEHLWLSEGFATYMADLYMREQHGEELFHKRLAEERQQTIDFYKKLQRPVVDTIGKEHPIELLNPNSYQKGAWILHMLRQKLGDALFQKSIREYYKTYKGKNAETDDLRRIAEDVSGVDLHSFFKQWLYQPGFPILEVSWEYDDSIKAVRVSLTQRQEQAFEFSLEIKLSNGDQSRVEEIDVDEKTETFYIPLAFKPKEILLDPEVKLLFEVKKVKRLRP